MQFLRSIILCLILVSVFFVKVQAQKTTFQKLYHRDYFNQALDVTALQDGGFAYIGIVDTVNQTQYVMLTKLDCEGLVQWSKKFGISSTIGNISPGITDTKEKDIVFTFNVGEYQQYDIIVVRVAYDGTVKWEKRLEAPGNNMGQAIVQTKDGGFVVAGSTGNYGSDVVSPFTDVYLLKFDSNGKVLWSKTYGNKSNIDEAFAVTEDANGNILTTGRHIVDGTFYTYILKTDALGNLKFIKGYGASNQASSAYGILVTKDQLNYVITGFTTINKNSFQDYVDVFVIKTDTSGVPKFTKIYYSYVGTDGSDSGTSIVETKDGNFGIGVATFSFSNHSQGFVPNKNAVFIIRNDGSLIEAKLYNQGGSHYTKLHSCYDGGYIISGFTNLGVAGGLFTPLMIKTDEMFNSGCKEVDVTDELEIQSDGWDVQDAPYISKKGDNFVDFMQQSFSNYGNTETYCENIPPLEVSIKPVASVCAGSLVLFSSTFKGSVVKWTWDFGDQTVIEADSTISHIYTMPGTYTVKLTGSSGCKETESTIQLLVNPPDITEQTIQLCQGDSILVNKQYLSKAGIYADTLQGIMCDSIVRTEILINALQHASIDTVICKGESLTLGNLIIFEAGIFIDTLPGNPCRIIYTYNLVSKDCVCDVEVPNVFSPNGDGKNDFFLPVIACGNNLSDYVLQVYNRWGKSIFETDDPKEGWDGNFNGIPAPSDAYVYVLKYNSRLNGISEMKSEKGDISLIR